MKNKTKPIAAAIAVALALTIQPVSAGTVAGFGGSTEITQLLNNMELGMLVGDSAKDIMVQIEQLSTQYQQLANMVQMAQQIKGGNFEALGLKLPAELKTIGETYVRAKNVYDSVQGTTQTMRFYAAAAERTNLQPSAVFAFVRRQAEAGRAEMQNIVQEDFQRFDRYKQSAESIAQLAKDTNKVTGTVAGLQHLASVSVKLAQLNDQTLQAVEAMVARGNRQDLRDADDSLAAAALLDKTVHDANLNREDAKRYLQKFGGSK